ncbi:putative eka-like protein [Erysiphe necator]|uniref:Putative eka-like protein n=1 Tax=Uncinula necator TaxID=52586 RepID=A0A0B1PC18_UNCNE|nr:putative eka-like protein [Erysiphe necator]
MGRQSHRIREVIVKKLHISPSLIGRKKPIQSDFTLSPCSPEAHEEIIKAGNGLFLSGAKLETATNWVSVLGPTVPASVQMEQGLVEVSKVILADEIERVCSVRPARLKMYGGNRSFSPNLVGLFTKAPHGGFRVFDEPGIARPYKKAPSCANYGSTNHVADSCMAATECKNCGGPHRADSRRCLARPTRSGAPSKEQMKTYRQMGEREYQAVQRARIAEEKAAVVDRIETDSLSSLASEESLICKNFPATPVKESTAVASRL